MRKCFFCSVAEHLYAVPISKRLEAEAPGGQNRSCATTDNINRSEHVFNPKIVITSSSVRRMQGVQQERDSEREKEKKSSRSPDSCFLLSVLYWKSDKKNGEISARTYEDTYRYHLLNESQQKPNPRRKHIPTGKRTGWSKRRPNLSRKKGRKRTKHELIKTQECKKTERDGNTHTSGS